MKIKIYDSEKPIKYLIPLDYKVKCIIKYVMAAIIIIWGLFIIYSMRVEYDNNPQMFNFVENGTYKDAFESPIIMNPNFIDNSMASNECYCQGEELFKYIVNDLYKKKLYPYINFIGFCLIFKYFLFAKKFKIKIGDDV